MKILKTVFRIFIKLIASIICLVAITVTAFYCTTTIYNSPIDKAFTGKTIYNPYENVGLKKYRANFHAHSSAWKSITYGNNTEKDVFEAYTNHGYDVAGVSNYHSISKYGEDKTDLYIPVYEHGYNIFKSHCLGIGTDDVSYFDYPLFQSTSHMQSVIEHIKQQNGYVAIAHPKFLDGRSFNNMRNLVHYDFVEVLNHYRVSDAYWDQALSAGRLSWIIGNDDIHNITEENTFKIWNHIYSAQRNPDSLLANMKIGKSYAIKSFNKMLENDLISLKETSASTFKITLDTIADSIAFVGQNGIQKALTTQSQTAQYTFNPLDAYIRIVVYNKNSHIYLNPLVRYDGTTLPLNTNVLPESNFIFTWLSRLFFALVIIGLLFLLPRIWKRRGVEKG